jgi:hypothetical protein
MSDSDYTLLQSNLDTVGCAIESAEHSTEGAARDGVLSIHDYLKGLVFDEPLLSKSHIRPQEEKIGYKTPNVPYLIWRSGASFLKASQGSIGQQVGGGKKKPIKGFSSNSRRGLMLAIAGVRLDADLPCFVTLTYPAKFPDPKSSKRHLKMFCQRLLRAFPFASGIWKLEPQDRGAPHYHLLIWNADEVELQRFVPIAWNEIAGDGDEYHLLFHLGLLHDSKPCVSLVRSFRGVWAYASKYLGKTFSVAGWDDLHTGRFWGFLNKEKIPFGELCQSLQSSKFVYQVMRYQRRFSHRRLRASGFTVFCDSQQWIVKLEVHQDK